MKAVLLTNHGGPEMLRYGEAPDPTAGPGEVVVDIHAASVNAADYKVRLGSGRSNLRFPYILGRDFSGVVSAVGPGVTDLAVGDAVFGVCDQGIEGAYAEKIAIKAAIIAKKPDRLGHAEAAAMALTSITALWALEDTAQLKAGETILIQGGAGGVAGFGIQLAKHLGATVITTAGACHRHQAYSISRRALSPRWKVGAPPGTSVASRISNNSSLVAPRRSCNRDWHQISSASPNRSPSQKRFSVLVMVS